MCAHTQSTETAALFRGYLDKVELRKKTVNLVNPAALTETGLVLLDSREDRLRREGMLVNWCIPADAQGASSVFVPVRERIDERAWG